MGLDKVHLMKIKLVILLFPDNRYYLHIHHIHQILNLNHKSHHNLMDPLHHNHNLNLLNHYNHILQVQVHYNHSPDQQHLH